VDGIDDASSQRIGQRYEEPELKSRATAVFPSEGFGSARMTVGDADPTDRLEELKRR
jgi:hypothetical protein